MLSQACASIRHRLAFSLRYKTNIIRKMKEMKVFKTCYELWYFCQDLSTMTRNEVESIPIKDLALLYCQANKLVREETYRLANELSLLPGDVWLVCLRNNRNLLIDQRVPSNPVIVNFCSLFNCKNYIDFQKVLVFGLCQNKHIKTSGSRFQQLYKRSLKKLGLSESENDNKIAFWGGSLRNGLFKIFRSKVFDLIMFFNVPYPYMRLRPELGESFSRPRFKDCNLPMYIHGDYQQLFVNQLIHYVFEAEPTFGCKKKDLFYLKNEKEVLCLLYDSRVKRDEDRIEYCIERMNSDDRYDFSLYTSCFVQLRIDERHPIKHEELSLLNELPIPKKANRIISYGYTYRRENINKCEMIVVLSK